MFTDPKSPLDDRLSRIRAELMKIKEYFEIPKCERLVLYAEDGSDPDELALLGQMDWLEELYEVTKECPHEASRILKEVSRRV